MTELVLNEGQQASSLLGHASYTLTFDPPIDHSRRHTGRWQNVLPPQ